MTPTARSLGWLRHAGFRHVQVVERWIPKTRRRVDLFGFIDVVVLDEYMGVLGIQVTTTGHLSDRVEKLRTECLDAMREWLERGNRLHLHGWSKKGPRGKRKLWTITVREITREDLQRGAA